MGYARRGAGDFEPADYFVPFVDLSPIERRRDKTVNTLTPTITKIRLLGSGTSLPVTLNVPSQSRFCTPEQT